MAFVYDADDTFERARQPRNAALVAASAHPHWEGVLRDLIARHVAETG